MKTSLAGLAALLATTGCGGLAFSGGGYAGPDGGSPDGSTSSVDSGSGENGSFDATAGGGSDASASGDSADAELPSFSSCSPGGPGLTNCGEEGESCCTSLVVAGGTFHRTYVYNSGARTGEADPATVSTFRLDKYEATVGRFRQFVTAWNGGGGWSPEAGSGKHKHLNGGSGLANSASPGTYETGWVMTDNGKVSPTSANLDCNRSSSTWTSEASTQENLPINCVNWYEAYAFCIWDGGFLPSEAEWEYAAGGGSQEREYPWGETDPGSGNQYAIYGCNYPSSSADCTRVTSIAPVGTPSAGAGVWGQLDLAGNVAELNLDWSAKYVKPCTDCAYLTRPLTSPSSNPDERVDHGGNYSYFASILQPPVRGTFPVARRYDFIGFRCARTP